MKTGNPEIDALRREEAYKNAANGIADLVVYPLQMVAEITNAVATNLYRLAIEKYRDQMPPEMVRMTVDAVIKRERQIRAERAAMNARLKSLPKFVRRRMSPLSRRRVS